MLIRVLLIGFWLAAAAALFLLTYHRFIMRLPHLRHKLLVMLGTAAAAAAAAVGLALLTGASPWLLVPLGLLLLYGAGEARRIAFRRRHEGEPPVEAVNAHISLLGPLTTFDLAVRRYEVPVARWPAGVRLRVAQISDLHACGLVPPRYFAEMRERLRDQAADVVVITGDFVTRRTALHHVPGAIVGIGARLGVFAVLGNHDYWEGSRDVRRMLADAGIDWIGTDTRRVAVAPGCGAVLSGCEQPWSPAAWMPPPLGRGDIGLVLTHTADNIYDLSGDTVHAVFAGHYHGGQARLPLWGSIVVPSRYGRRFDHGHFVVAGTHLFVTSGVGASFPPIRLWCKPEILVVDFVGGGPPAASDGGGAASAGGRSQ